MRTLALSLVSALLFSLMACESAVEEVETVCLPVNVSITQVQGSMTTKIIADFHYVPDSDLIDHITWSNHQTHYFEYDASGRLSVLKVMRVDTKVQQEKWFVYDGEQVERVDLVIRNLDYVYLEPLDSIHTGYIMMEYNGELITRERQYELVDEGENEDFVKDVRYQYDAQGNLTSINTMYPMMGESISQNMTYDQSKHPFGDLQYYFNGESYVNNMLSKADSDTGFEYSYELQLNEYEYPDAIFEKLGSSNTRIFKYAYKTT